MGVILTLAVLLPLAGAAGVCLAGARAERWVRPITLGTALAVLLLAIPVVVSPPGLRVVEWRWLDQPEISFALGADGTSALLVGLTTLLMVTSVLVSWEAVKEHAAGYYALLLALESGMLGVFTAMDVVLFYIFFEFTLVPLFFIIGIWGGPERRAAARKFFLYTLAGSVLTLLGLVYLVVANADPATGSGKLTFSIPELLENLRLPFSVQYWVFLALFAGFAIKVPLFPFHTWLPLAHVEAPTAGSVLLAGVLLKIGGYGFVRFSLPLLPDASAYFLPMIAVLSVIGIIYGAMVALAQSDIKRLVAYSSVSHMGFCVLGLFAPNAVGVSGGIVVMVAHGLATGALFALVGMLYERYHSRQIDDFHGLARRMPLMTFFVVVMALSSLGLPGLAGFVGEAMVLFGMFRAHPAYAVAAAVGMVLGAWYLLWWIERCFHGPLREPGGVRSGQWAVGSEGRAAGSSGRAVGGKHESEGIGDLKAREVAALAPLAVMIVWIGVYPQFFLRRVEPAVEGIVASRAVGGTASREGQRDRATRIAKPMPEQWALQKQEGSRHE